MDLPIAMIGVGGLGYLQAKTFDRIEGVRIVAAADVSQDARRVFEETFGAPAYEHYRQLFHEHSGDLAAVAIVTPHTLHYEQALAAIEQGLHVLIEKPMVTDVADAVDLVDAAAANDVILQVGYQRHFHPAFREIRRVITDGRLGALHTANAYLGQNWIDLHRDAWRTDPSLSGGGQLYDTGSHLLDALLWTTDAEPSSVTAFVEFAEPKIDVNSAISMELEAPDGSMVASLGLTGDGIEVDPHEGYVYWGDAGRLSYDGDALTIAETDAPTYTTQVEGGTDFETLNRRKIENFAAAIDGTADPAVPGEVGVAVTALTEAIYDAAETSAPVDVQPLIDRARE